MPENKANHKSTNPLQSITISEQCLITFDKSRNLLNSMNQMDLILQMDELNMSSVKLQKIVAYNHELYSMGLLLSNRYIKQLEKMKLLELENERLKKENENLKRNIK